MYFPPEAFFGSAEAGLLRAAIAPMMAGHETVRPAQVCELQETLCAGSAQSAPPTVLREDELPGCAEGGIGPAVAGQAGGWPKFDGLKIYDG